MKSNFKILKLQLLRIIKSIFSVSKVDKNFSCFVCSISTRNHMRKTKANRLDTAACRMILNLFIT